ncbi:MAG: GntR family transcriptional regulator [Akkermansiaceae bacterium]|nr:GntR family transcriptional regulator [Akkermansiaceae bacterium]
MSALHRLSVAQLSAGHLRKDLWAGRWSGLLPGVARLAAELDVSRDTIRDALRLLERMFEHSPRTAMIADEGRC